MLNTEHDVQRKKLFERAENEVKSFRTMNPKQSSYTSFQQKL